MNHQLTSSKQSNTTSTSKIPTKSHVEKVWTRALGNTPSPGKRRLRRVSSSTEPELSLADQMRGTFGSSPSLSLAALPHASPMVAPARKDSTSSPLSKAGKKTTGVMSPRSPVPGTFNRRRSQSAGSLVAKLARKSKIPVSRYTPANAARIAILQKKEQELLEQLENVRQQLKERKSSTNFNIQNHVVNNSPAATIVNSPTYSRAIGSNIRPLSAIRPSQRFLF